MLLGWASLCLNLNKTKNMVMERAFQAEETDYVKLWEDGKKPSMCKNTERVPESPV